MATADRQMQRRPSALFGGLIDVRMELQQVFGDVRLTGERSDMQGRPTACVLRRGIAGRGDQELCGGDASFLRGIVQWRAAILIALIGEIHILFEDRLELFAVARRCNVMNGRRQKAARCKKCRKAQTTRKAHHLASFAKVGRAIKA